MWQGVHSEWAAGSPKRRASRRWCGKDIAGQRFRRIGSSFATDSRCRIRIIGEAERGDQQSDREARRLRGLAERLGVADRLRVHAHATDAEIPELLRSADVVACTPTYEPSGVVALEATACGVPGGGLRGRDLAASVNHLLRDSFLRRSLGTGGRNRAVARYSWDRIAVDTARLYEKSMSALAGERTAAS